MTLSEAARLVHMFKQFWPSASMPKETAALWAHEIQRYDPMDVAEAAGLLGESRQWMPSLAEFIEGIKECRRDRLGAEAPAELPHPDDLSFAEFLHRNPEWAERVKTIAEKLTSKYTASGAIKDALTKMIEPRGKVRR